MSKKLYYYTDLKGTSGWAVSAEAFREEYSPKGHGAYRVAHKGVPAPEGYQKTGDELAHQPAVIAAPKPARSPRYQKFQNFAESERT